MASEEYWKDKRVEPRQVLFAWAMVIALAGGAHYGGIAYRAIKCATGGSALSAAASDSQKLATFRFQSLR